MNLRILFFVVTLLTTARSYAQVAENDFNFIISAAGIVGTVNCLAVQSDGKVVVGGNFTSYNGTTRNYLLRLNTNGTLDSSFDPGTTLNAPVTTVAVESGGSILVGGSFAGVLKRLTSTGAADGSLVLAGTGLDGLVTTIALQTDGKIIVGGNFTNYNGTSRNRIARINTNGSLDAMFNPGTGFNGLVRSVAIMSTGKIVVVGGASGFSTFNGTARDNLALLTAAGTLEAMFVPPANLFARLYDVKIQSDDKVIITGEYNGNINSMFNGVARLNVTGSFDNTFTPTFFQGGRSIAIQSDGKILIAGLFDKNIKRLNTNGTDDGFFGGEGFFKEGAAQSVNAVVVQEGKPLAAGDFTSFNGIYRVNMARITSCPSVGITTHPQPQTNCVSGNAVFTVVATGTGLTYQWQWKALNQAYFSNLSEGSATGTLTPTITLSSINSGMNGISYRCLVSDGLCTTTSGASMLTVVPTPTINSHPAPTASCEGGVASFTVSVTDPGNYQWQENAGSGFVNIVNGGIYSGVTSATLTLTGITNAMNARQYRCRVGSCDPLIFTNQADLTVNLAPVITTQPQASASVCTGGSVQFQIEATSAASYQWQEKIGANSFINISNGGIYGGATAATLVLTGVTTTQSSNQYRCVVAGANTCTTTSSAVSLTVYTTPVITSHPVNSSKCVSAGTTFSVVVGSPAGLTYQWQEKSGAGDFVNLSNGGVYSNVTMATLSLTGLTALMNGNKYRCIVGTCLTPVISFDADLIVDSPPVITQGPAARTICTGMSTTFGVTATGLGLTFQWQRDITVGSFTYIDLSDEGIYSGTATEVLTITNATGLDNGFRYRCVVKASGVCSASTTALAPLTVRPLPIFNTHPVDISRCEGFTANFSSSANNAFSAFQWQADTGSGFTDLVAGEDYPNVTSSTLNFPAKLSQSGNKYRCRVGSCLPDVYSNEGELTVNASPAISASPEDATICAGEDVSFSVAATGSSLSYQWQRSMTGDSFSNLAEGEGSPYTGTTSPTLVITSAATVLNGVVYQCRVSGVCSPAVTSMGTTLIISETKIQEQPVSIVSSCEGGNESFSITASGTSLTYQWMEQPGSGQPFVNIIDDGIYSGATTSTLVLTGITAQLSNHKYQCVVTGSCGGITSQSASIGVAILSKPVISVNVNNPEAPVLQSSGGQSYQWFRDGTAINGATSSTFQVTEVGSFTVQAKVGNCVSPLSDPKVIVVTGDLHESLEGNVILYPNPVAHTVNISLHGFRVGAMVSVRVMDLLGRSIDQTEGEGGSVKVLNVQSYSAGRYVVALQNSEQTIVTHFNKSN